MSDLYTSLVHLKRLLAGQATPAFTPAPEAVLKMLDPAFFPGMGALNEDEHGRLQCPVRECGEWHRYLGGHIRWRHKAIGGMSAVRDALGIPLAVSLLSAKERDKVRTFTAPHLAKASKARTGKGRFVTGDGRGGAHRGGAYSASQQSAHRKNWTDTCPAQLQAKIVALRDQLGRSPSGSDFENEYGRGAMKAAVAVFGSWNAAKATCGLSMLTHSPTYAAGIRVSAALAAESLLAWYNVHGDLPTTTDTKNTTRAPMVPSERAIRSAFGVSTWEAAMRSAVEHLGITSERYGSPKRRSA